MENNVHIFGSPREKGSREWKSVGDVIREGQIGGYQIVTRNAKKIGHFRGNQPQFLVLKHAR